MLGIVIDGFVADTTEELTVLEGDKITIAAFGEGERIGWVYGIKSESAGWIPEVFIDIQDEGGELEEEHYAQFEKLSSDQVLLERFSKEIVVNSLLNQIENYGLFDEEVNEERNDEQEKNEEEDEDDDFRPSMDEQDENLSDRMSEDNESKYFDASDVFENPGNDYIILRNECKICGDEKELMLCTLNCTHPEYFCQECLQGHLKVEIEEKTECTCPEIGCGQEFSPSDIQRIVDKTLYERYSDIQTLNFLRSLKEFRWCKDPKCGSGQTHETDDPIMICCRCKASSCFFHDIPWHKGLTCQQYDNLLKEEEKANDDYKLKNTKKCPKCTYPIEKNDGCDKMVCTCKYEFCWLCLADYDMIRKEGNHFHNANCKHYRAIEPPQQA